MIYNEKFLYTKTIYRWRLDSEWIRFSNFINYVSNIAGTDDKVFIPLNFFFLLIYEI